MTRMARVACSAALVVPAAWSVRESQGHEEASALSSMGTLEQKEHQSMMTTRARFAEAFADDPEQGGAAPAQCPYGEGDESKAGGENSFSCNWFSPGKGATCPQLQTDRLRIARRFNTMTAVEFVTRGKDFKLKPLFDKSKRIIGDENYEKLVKYQIEGLVHDDVVDVEDKIILKKTAARLGIPATTSYFGAHDDDFDEAVFSSKLSALCGEKVDNFIIKATHLAWSGGQKIVRGWQSTCSRGEDALRAKIGELIAFVKKDVLGVKASEADMHLRLMKAGVTVEELFRTGGPPNEPLETKIFVLWGKAHSMAFRGADNRNCLINPYSWNFYADKAGWDFSGTVEPMTAGDSIGDRVRKEIFDDMVRHAEAFAKDVGADYMRVDFFIGVPDDPSQPLFFKLNECESVSGGPAYYDRQGMGEVWLNGYVMSDHWAMTPEKWTSFEAKTQADRDDQYLDDPSGNH